MGGGGGAISPPDPSFTSGPMGSPEPNPDPNPTMRSPSDPPPTGLYIFYWMFYSKNVNILGYSKYISKEKGL